MIADPCLAFLSDLEVPRADAGEELVPGIGGKLQHRAFRGLRITHRDRVLGESHLYAGARVTAAARDPLPPYQLFHQARPLSTGPTPRRSHIGAKPRMPDGIHGHPGIRESIN